MLYLKPVPDFPGYSCDQSGNVYSERRKKNLIQLRPHLRTKERGGYATVTLYSGFRVGKVKLVHQVVARTFLGPPPPLHEVNHKNGNRADNRVDNLEWVTRAQNEAHKAKVLGTGNRGSRHGQSKLTEHIVVGIKKELKIGANQHAIARKFNVCASTICRINSGEVWGWLHVV